VTVGTHYGDLVDPKWSAFLRGTASPLGEVQEFEILSFTGGGLGRNATLDGKSSEAVAKEITRICEVIPLDLVLLNYETKTLIVQVVLLNEARSGANLHLPLKDVTWKQDKTDGKWELSGETSYFNSRSLQAETLMIVVHLRAQTSLSHIPSRLNGTTVPRCSWPRIPNTARDDAQNAGRLINMLLVSILGKCCSQQEVQLYQVFIQRQILGLAHNEDYGVMAGQTIWYLQDSEDGWVTLDPSAEVVRVLQGITTLPPLVMTVDLADKVIFRIEQHYVQHAQIVPAWKKGALMLSLNYAE